MGRNNKEGEEEIERGSEKEVREREINNREKERERRTWSKFSQYRRVSRVENNGSQQQRLLSSRVIDLWISSCGNFRLFTASIDIHT